MLTSRKALGIPPCPILMLSDDGEDFAQKVMCQHYFISYGDNRVLLNDLCEILGITVI